MFPWINHTCILEHLFFTELIFKKRSHISWQCSLKTAKKWIFKATVYSPNSVVQETRNIHLQQKMFPWINHTCILEHLFSTELIFKKRSHVLWQCWLKTNALSSQPSNTKFRRAKEPLYNKKVSLEQYDFGTFFLQRVYFEKRSHISWQCSLKAAKMHIQCNRLLAKFRGARNIHLQQNVPLDQPYMHFGTCVP